MNAEPDRTRHPRIDRVVPSAVCARGSTVTSKRRVAADPALSTLSADSASREPGADEPARRSAAPIRDPERYDVLGEHGRGGLGRVSRVHDKDLGRDIAIKELLSRGHLNELRFAREAMITARLEHPGIAPVHEAGGGRTARRSTR